MTWHFIKLYLYGTLQYQLLLFISTVFEMLVFAYFQYPAQRCYIINALFMKLLKITVVLEDNADSSLYSWTG